MPEPAAHRYMSHGHSSRWQLAGKAVPPGAEPLHTADQVRKAILAATERERERAARVVEEVGPKEGSIALVTKGFADAIRGMK